MLHGDRTSLRPEGAGARAFALDFRPIWLIFAVGVGAALAQGIFYVGHVSLVAQLVGQGESASPTVGSRAPSR